MSCEQNLSRRDFCKYSNDFNLMGMISTSIFYSTLAVREREKVL